MSVPEEIRNVPRPKNTVIVPYGKNKDKYAVRSRIGCERKDGKCLPIDGPVIGHIVNMKYVPKDFRERISCSDTDYKRWADVKLCCDLNEDLLKDLITVYNTKDAECIFVMAVLRTLEFDVDDCEMKEAYEDTFLTMMYPDVHLSPNTVSKFINDLGEKCSQITEFMRIRTGRVDPTHHIAVDGTLKSDESKVNTFSDYSRKALKKGTKDISVLYAYDIDSEEPICSKAYSGNSVDVSLLKDFIETQGITRGVIIADKGFSYRTAKTAFLDNPDLHFLIPLKRNAKCIETYHMYDYNSTLTDSSGTGCRKERMNDGLYLYSYQDCKMEAEEERKWKCEHENEIYDPLVFASERRKFGSIVFISDVDFTLEEAYKAYQERWEIEVMFRFYKDILKFDKTKVHSDTSVLGTEFINFLSVLMECRLKKAFSKVEALKDVTYEHILKKLRRGVKIKSPDGEWQLRKLTNGEMNIMSELGIIKIEPVAKGKVGRPRKNGSSA